MHLLPCLRLGANNLLKFYEVGFSCKVVIDDEISSDDFEHLKYLLEKNYHAYNIEFVRIYTLSARVLKLLYTHIEVLKKHITIVVHKSRLSRYLHILGINSHFESQIKERYRCNPNANILAIGGSADSGEKIIDILSAIDTKRFCIFIIQHISPDKEGVFDQILSRLVESDVSYAKDGDKVKLGHIYIASRDKHMLIKDERIILDDGEYVNAARPSISTSFNALSDAYKENFLGILECGYGLDGVDALSTLKNNNSTIIIQDPKSCRASSIVKQAKAQGIYDFVFSTSEICSYLNFMGVNFEIQEQWIKYLLEEVYKKYEYDFRLYQPALVKRRVSAFMIKHGIKDMKTLVVLVLYFKSAFRSLFLEISINVTEFFRKHSSTLSLIEALQEYRHSYNIKIWSAGCSSGEEVYSTAIILRELGLLHKSLIYATDFNPVVIQEAKNGIYPIDVFQHAKEKYADLNLESSLDQYFNIYHNMAEVKKEIKEKVMFFVHNLEKDSVFNEFDIIECKNVLIYFNDDLQEHVFQLFYDSLKFGGYLFLGPSESLPKSYESRFKVCDKSFKTYKKVL